MSVAMDTPYAWTQTLKKRRYHLLPLLGGILLTLAFAPFDFSVLGVLAPALLVLSCLTVPPATAFWRGWLFGLGFFGTGISWVYVSIHVFGNTQAWLAGLLTGLFVMVLALFPALQSWAWQRWCARRSPLSACCGFGLLWLASEGLRTWLFTGFPWLLLGNAQLFTPISGYAPIFSVYGVSLLTAVTAAGVATLLFTARQRLLILVLLLSIWLIGWGLQNIRWTQPTENPLTISLVQGNISQQLKWQPAYLSDILEHYVSLTQPLWKSAQLIVWPEAAIPTLARQDHPFLQDLQNRAQAAQATLITGVPLARGAQYYNGLIMLGSATGRYEKRHLVPFGEYLPLAQYLRGLINFFQIPMSDFSAGALQQPNLKLGHETISPFICYEIAYPFLVKNSVRDAAYLLTISDDSWFGRSIAPEQHLQIAQMRSLETGRPQLIATNDGVTAFTDGRGKLLSRLPRYHSGVLTHTMVGVQGDTPWLAQGSLWLALLVGLTGLGAMLGRRSASL